MCYDAVLHLHSFMGNVWSETLNCQRHENIEGHGQEPAIESIILEMERIVQRKRRREWQPQPREPRIAFAFALHCVLQETRAKLLVGRFSRTIENERVQEPRSRSVRSWPGPLSSSVTVRRVKQNEGTRYRHRGLSVHVK